MKRFLYAILVAIFLVGLVSCKGHGNEPEDNKNKKTIVLTVDSVGETICYFSVTPSDTLAPYYIDLKPQSMVLGLDTQELLKDFKAGMDIVINIAADQGLEYTYADFCKNGAHRFAIGELIPQTDYVLYAYYLDTATGWATGEICSMPFRTKEIEVVGEREVQMTDVNFEWSETQSNWTLSTFDAEQQYSLLIFSQHNGQKTGTFTIANGDFWMATLFVTGDGLYEFVELTITISETETGLYLITIDGLASDGYRYHITMDPTPLIEETPQEVPVRMAPKRAIITCAK